MDRKEYFRLYYLANKIEIKKKSKEYYLKNKDKISDYFKQRYPKYKKELLQYQKIYHKNNPENRNQYYLKNREKTSEQMRIWRRTEEGKAAIQRGHVKRNTREREIINTLTLEEWLDILKQYDYKCAYCGCDFNENTLPEKDHIIPISKNGHNIKENIVPACRSCNAKKSNKILLIKELII